MEVEDLVVLKADQPEANHRVANWMVLSCQSAMEAFLLYFAIATAKLVYQSCCCCLESSTVLRPSSLWLGKESLLHSNGW